MVYRSHLRIRFIITTFDIIDKKKKTKNLSFYPNSTRQSITRFIFVHTIKPLNFFPFRVLTKKYLKKLVLDKIKNLFRYIIIYICTYLCKIFFFFLNVIKYRQIRVSATTLLLYIIKNPLAMFRTPMMTTSKPTRT